MVERTARSTNNRSRSKNIGLSGRDAEGLGVVRIRSEWASHIVVDNSEKEPRRVIVYNDVKTTSSESRFCRRTFLAVSKRRKPGPFSW